MKREGDGATPAGRLDLLAVYFRADRMRRPLPWGALRPLRRDIGWCDDAGHGQYNREVALPFAGSHEILFREDHVYDLVGVLDWNYCRRSLGRGSAIFLHVARETGEPTEGCIALHPRDMRVLLGRLRRDAVFVIA